MMEEIKATEVDKASSCFCGINSSPTCFVVTGEPNANERKTSSLSVVATHRSLQGVSADVMTDIESRDQQHGRYDEMPICRICFTGDDEESLVQPCNCKGSIGFVHMTCLSKWQMRENTDNCCNMCLAPYAKLFQLPWPKRCVKLVLRTLWMMFMVLLSLAVIAGILFVFLVVPVSIVIYFTFYARREFVRTQELLSYTNLAAATAYLFALYLLYGFYCLVTYVVMYVRVVLGLV